MAGAVAKILDDLRARGGLKGTDVANITAVSPATVSRWTAGKAFPHPKTQLVISDLRYVVDRLAEFYSPDETRIIFSVGTGFRRCSGFDTSDGASLPDESCE
jgi:transcriptional regulator with XRE-family HTH domain